MKYPQLVPTRAVNAISDWLVSRLEQLGVEAPQIYTRLLLSLLQSTVQLNDPIEFSNFEQFFANRKSGGSGTTSKRHLPCRDTVTLKKLNAIQCLKEIVSSEAELETIEQLVDELYEKLKSLDEQQTSDDVLNVEQVHAAVCEQEAITLTTTTTASTTCNCVATNSNSSTNTNNNHTSTSSSSTVTFEIETDPKKRYFRAFPALNKEMEDSFLYWRPNAKSLTWPIVATHANNIANTNNNTSSSNNNSSNSSSCSSSSNISNDSEKKLLLTNANVAICVGANEKQQQKQQQHIAKLLNEEQIKQNNETVVAGGLKRKSRRRRNQALSKSLRYNTIAAENAVAAVAERRQHQRPLPTTSSQRRNTAATRSTPTTYWDTDFEGCWEMGRDLIKEFITKQNKRNNRNRSTSESAAYGLRQLEDTEEAAVAETVAAPMEEKSYANTLNKCFGAANAAADFDEDTLASVLELTEDTTMNELTAVGGISSPYARRLYQRDELEQTKPADKVDANVDDDVCDNDVHLNIAKFKAKFNSSVEALWKDAPTITTTTEPQSLTTEIGAFSINELNNTFPAIAPAKEQLKNFWTNYYNHHFDVEHNNNMCQAEQSQQQQLENCNSLNYEQQQQHDTQLDAAIADYYSMPSNMHDYAPIKTSIGGGNMFLNDSIWTDLIVPTSQQQQQHVADWPHAKPGEIHCAGLQFPPYNISKWSEGINAGPITTMQSQPQQQHLLHVEQHALLQQQHDSSNNSYGADCTDSSAPTSVSAISWSSSYGNQPASSAAAAAVFANNSWQTPILGANMPTDLLSWSAANPTALTKMYTQQIELETSADETAAGNNTTVTLLNHSSSSSCFVEYARIKNSCNSGSSGKNSNSILHRQSSNQQQPQQQQQQQQQQPMRYADDENLLTSERTHFYPIKSYADGYTFDICSTLEVIDYERSASGYLILEKQRYLEYVRNDNFLMEEDANATTVGASAAPLYAGSNCEAAKARLSNPKRAAANSFVLKFRLRNCEVACQTEEQQQQRELNLFTQYPLCVLFDEHLNQQTTNANVSCNEAIAALNHAVAAAAMKADDEAATDWRICCKQPAIVYVDHDSEATDLNMLEQQWSMHEIGKKCQLKGHDGNSGNNAAVVGAAGNTPSMWTMCTACNNEFKSVPANHLLRDALKLDGDEIMSDLRYMQDMYIGRHRHELDINSDSEWDADEAELDNVDDDDDDDSGTETGPFELEMSPQNMYEQQQHQQRQGDDEVETTFQWQTTQVNEEVLQKVNRLIADLLRNESAAAADAAEYQLQLNASDEMQQQQQQTQRRQLADDDDDNATDNCIWSNDYISSNNIWQQHDADAATAAAAFKPLELLKRLHAGVDDETVWMQQQQNNLNWEHAHLKEIWQRQTPPITTAAAAAATASETATDTSKAIEKQATIAVDEQTVVANEMNEQIVTKNLKNLQANDVVANTTTATAAYFTNDNVAAAAANKTTTTAAETDVIASAVFYKRMQQFLNSTAACNTSNKLKLCNRKRRHSASQNWLQHLSSTLPSYNDNSNYNNNNNVNIVDLNRFNFKMLQLAPVAATTTTVNTKDNVDNDGADINAQQKLINQTLRNVLCQQKQAEQQQQQQQAKTSNNSSDDVQQQQQKQQQPTSQTFFTCKYWTTIDPMNAANDLIVNNTADDAVNTTDAATATTTFSCLIDKNAEILKHVAMVARPLTR